MNDNRLLTIVETKVARGVSFLVLFLIAISLVKGQPLRGKGLRINYLPDANGTRVMVRVHDAVQRPQIAAPQQSRSVTGNRSPSGTICGVESRAAHGQTAPNTNGGTLDPVAFINPTTANASGRVAFNSQVDGSTRNQGVFVADSDGTITAIAIGCGGLGGSGVTTSMCGDASPIGGHFGGFFFGTCRHRDDGFRVSTELLIQCAEDKAPCNE